MLRGHLRDGAVDAGGDVEQVEDLALQVGEFGWKVRSTVPSVSVSSWRATPVKISRIRAVVGAAQPRSSG